MILLDTSVLTHVFGRSRPDSQDERLAMVVEGLMRAEAPLGLPGVVLQDVLCAVRSEKQVAELTHRLTAAFTIVVPSAVDHVEAARIRRKCLSKGVAASASECLIAAQTIVGGHELLSVDGVFEALARHAPLRLFPLKRGRSRGRRAGAADGLSPAVDVVSRAFRR